MTERDPGASRHPRLIPLTPEARNALASDALALKLLPFRIGRDLRDPGRGSSRLFRERRRPGTDGPNDLYLREPGPRHRLSRRHLLIGHERGRFYVEDRRSTCGTVVEGEHLGGRRRGGRRDLAHGDTIRVGGDHSPFAFRFLAPDGQPD